MDQAKNSREREGGEGAWDPFAWGDGDSWREEIRGQADDRREWQLFVPFPSVYVRVGVVVTPSESGGGFFLVLRQSDLVN